MPMPQEEEIKKQRKAPSSSFMPYLLHRLDGMEAKLEAKIDKLDAKVETVEANLRGEITGLRQEMNSRIDGLHGEITGLRQETNTRMDGLHRGLHNTTLWIVGTIVAVVGIAVAVMQALK